MNYTLHTLQQQDLSAIESHLKRLNKEDRYMRFCAALSDHAIENYVKQMNLSHEYGLGVFVDAKLVAFAVICPVDSKDGKHTAEFGISIHKEYRSGGIAQAMLQASINFCKKQKISLLYMMCLHENKKMQALARNHGLKVVFDRDEAYAEIAL